MIKSRIPDAYLSTICPFLGRTVLFPTNCPSLKECENILTEFALIDD